MVLLLSVDGEILLLPIRVRHVEIARTWLPTLLQLAAPNIQSFKFLDVIYSTCVIAIHVFSGKIRFFRLTTVHFIDL